MRGLRRYPARDVLTALVFVLPTLLVFAVFKYYPLFYNFYLCTTRWNFFSPVKKPVGLANFQAILVSPVFWQVLRNTLTYTFWSAAISIVLGFAVAVAVYRRRGFWGSAVKTAFFIPNITTAAAVAILWVWIFDADAGLVGQVFHWLGLVSPRWLLEPRYAMGIVISLSVWRSVGYVMLIYGSGLAGIPEEIFDAARIDGASGLQTVLRIVIPHLSPVTFFLVVTSFISAMQVFDIVQVMTGGGPYGTTMVLNLHIYQTAFVKAQAGVASALSVILFLILLAFTVAQRRISERWVQYV